MNETKAKSNTAQIRVKQLIIDSGFEVQPKEKDFNFIERYLLAMQSNQAIAASEHKATDDSNNECNELLRATIEELESAVIQIETLKEQVLFAESEQGENNNQENQELASDELSSEEVTFTNKCVDLLKESATGFADGLHFRSYCYRVMELVESQKVK